MVHCISVRVTFRASHHTNIPCIEAFSRLLILAVLMQCITRTRRTRCRYHTARGTHHAHGVSYGGTLGYTNLSRPNQCLVSDKDAFLECRPTETFVAEAFRLYVIQYESTKGPPYSLQCTKAARVPTPLKKGAAYTNDRLRNLNGVEPCGLNTPAPKK